MKIINGSPAPVYKGLEVIECLQDDGDLTSYCLHYAINDLDNALYCIGYNDFLLFMEIDEALSPVIEKNVTGARKSVWEKGCA